VPEKSRLLSAISKLQTYFVDEGATHINEGAVWGWRVLSPQWRGRWAGSPSNLPLAYGTANMDKVLVVLTDGDNTFLYDQWPAGSNSVVGPYTAYKAGEPLLGIPDDVDGILSGNATSMRNSAQTELNNRTRSVCKSIRDEGIFVYAVTFGSVSAGGKGLMQNCASQPTSKYYFHSSNNAALLSAFQQIGTQLNNLRIKR
jgi:hypothetical protein